MKYFSTKYRSKRIKVFVSVCVIFGLFVTHARVVCFRFTQGFHYTHGTEKIVPFPRWGSAVRSDCRPTRTAGRATSDRVQIPARKRGHPQRYGTAAAAIRRESNRFVSRPTSSAIHAPLRLCVRTTPLSSV